MKQHDIKRLPKWAQHDIKRLPKWAQHHIERLEADLAASRREVREMAGVSNQPTEVFIWRGMELDPLPRRTQIRFLVDGPCKNDRDHIDVKVRNGRLDIMGSRTYRILPRASNAIEIALED